MRAVAMALGPVLALLLVGCASPGVDAAPGAPSAEVRIGLTEWTIVVAPDALAEVGEVELVITNTGGTRHDLVVTGAHGRWESPTLDPGERHVLPVTTASGETLALVCTLPGHRRHGMHATLPVASLP